MYLEKANLDHKTNPNQAQAYSKWVNLLAINYVINSWETTSNSFMYNSEFSLQFDEIKFQSYFFVHCRLEEEKWDNKLMCEVVPSILDAYWSMFLQIEAIFYWTEAVLFRIQAAFYWTGAVFCQTEEVYIELTQFYFFFVLLFAVDMDNMEPIFYLCQIREGANLFVFTPIFKPTYIRLNLLACLEFCSLHVPIIIYGVS